MSQQQMNGPPPPAPTMHQAQKTDSHDKTTGDGNNKTTRQTLGGGAPFPDLELLADALKSEISTTLTGVIDTIMAKFAQQRSKQQSKMDADSPTKDVDRKSPRTKVIDRGSHGGDRNNSGMANGLLPKMINGGGGGGYGSGGPVNQMGVGNGGGGGNGLLLLPPPPPPPPTAQPQANGPADMRNGLANTTCGGVYGGVEHARSAQQMFAPKLHGSAAAGLSNAAAAAALYSSMSGLPSHLNPFCVPEREPAPEQSEALSLVIIPKKKRHKVTDTRITPRTVSRILAQDSSNNNNNGSSGGGGGGNSNNNGSADSSGNRMLGNGGGPTAAAAATTTTTTTTVVQPMSATAGDSTPPPQQPRGFQAQAAQPPPPPMPMLPVSLPTSVAIPNPSLHESQVFSPYSPFYTSQHQPGPHHIPSSSPPGMSDSPPTPPQHMHSSLLHPALLAAAQHHNSSPDLMMNMKARMDMSMGAGGNDSVDRISECNSGDGPYDGMSPIISFLYKNTITTLCVYIYLCVGQRFDYI